MSPRPRHGRGWLPPSLALCALLLGWSGAASAHSFDPALVTLTVRGDGLIDVIWRVAVTDNRPAALTLDLPDTCRDTSPHRRRLLETSLAESWTMACEPADLAGLTLSIQGLGHTSGDAVVRIERRDSPTDTHVITASAPRLTIPERAPSGHVALVFGRLGVEHIALGADHLLFVLGLVLLVRGRRRLLVTVTAFTLGHSLTLALATLEVVRLRSGPVELLIAMSILMLAVELTRSKEAPPGLTTRFPWVVAGGFGLLHGLGFAGALAEIGLPAGEVPAALLAFNLGVELGQIAFIATLGLVWLALRGLRPRWPVLLERLPAYAMGVMATAWILGRLGPLLP